MARGAVAVVAEAEEIEGLRAISGLRASGRCELGGGGAGMRWRASRRRGMKVIGVTGTKGKTTVAYLLRWVLKAAGFRWG